MLNGCTPKPGANGIRRSSATSEGAIVEEVADLILPRTDRGARDVGVPAFIECDPQDAYPADDQSRFISGLKDFDSEAQRAHGKPFLELPQAQRLAYLQQVHDAAAAAEKTQADNDVPTEERKRPFVLMMKELTMLGVLHFAGRRNAGVAVRRGARRLPGRFPIAKAGNGKQWATETSLRF